MENAPGSGREKILKLFTQFFVTNTCFVQGRVCQLTKFKIALFLGDDKIIFHA